MMFGLSQLGVIEIVILAMIFVGALGIAIGAWLAIAAGALRPLISLTKRIQRRTRRLCQLVLSAV